MFKKDFLRRSLAIAFFLFLAGFSFPSFAQAVEEKEPDNYVQVRLITDKTQVQGGDTVRIGLEQTIYPGWHVYWLNPGDSGTPTTIDWNLPPGFFVSDLEWPLAEKIPYGPLTNYGYEGQATLLQNLTLASGIGSTPFALEAKVNLLVCKEICIPEAHDVSLEFNAGTIAEPDKIAAAEALLPETQEWQTSFYERNGQLVFKTVVEDVSLLNGATNITLLPEEWGVVDNNADASLEFLNTGFSVSQKRDDRELSETPEIPIVLSYETANGNHQSIRLVATADKEASAITVPASPENGRAEIGLWQALLFAVFGGLILNLMPCVFPVLSIKAISLINLKGKEEQKARAYGLSYTAGILLSFGLIGGTLLALKAGGAQIGWGFQLQSPVVIALLAYLVFIIGLNLSGLFEFSGRFASLGQKLTQKSGHRGAFFTGVLATLVATPCTAPFMGVAMGFALTQPASISMVVFLSLGFGLALPYLALCYIPALRKKLPKPGHWMQTFRQFLAFPMFITAAWLVWVLSQQISSTGVFCTLVSMVAIVFIIWLLHVIPASGMMRKVSQLFLILSIGFVVTSPFILESAGQESTTIQQNGDNWEEFTPGKLADLLKGDEAVFTNMTASWCITCKVNEKIALTTDSAKKLFAEKNIRYLKGDWTNRNPDITHYLNKFDRNGVPLYVYYGPRDTESGERPEPVILPQILSPGIIEKTIQ